MCWWKGNKSGLCERKGGGKRWRMAEREKEEDWLASWLPGKGLDEAA